jgi:hypothetical protein
MSNLVVRSLTKEPGKCSPYLPNGIGKTFPKLTYIYYEECELQFINRRQLSNLDKVWFLSFDTNKLVDFPHDTFYDMTHMGYLVLANNKLTKLDPRMFERMTNLRRFHVQNNFIQTLEGSLFDGNPRITGLGFEGNGIKRIDADFRKLKELKSLEFGESDCVMRSFPGVSLDELTGEMRNKCRG